MSVEGVVGTVAWGKWHIMNHTIIFHTHPHFTPTHQSLQHLAINIKKKQTNGHIHPHFSFFWSFHLVHGTSNPSHALSSIPRTLLNLPMPTIWYFSALCILINGPQSGLQEYLGNNAEHESGLPMAHYRYTVGKTRRYETHGVAFWWSQSTGIWVLVLVLRDLPQVLMRPDFLIFALLSHIPHGVKRLLNKTGKMRLVKVK